MRQRTARRRRHRRRMQIDRAMAIDDALGIPGGAAGIAHRRRRALIDGGKRDI